MEPFILWMSTVQVCGGYCASVLLGLVVETGVLQMFAVAKSAGYGITVDQSGAVLDKWSPPHIVSDNNG